jgi:hypothetical protein
MTSAASESTEAERLPDDFLVRAQLSHRAIASDLFSLLLESLCSWDPPLFGGIRGAGY